MNAEIPNPQSQIQNPSPDDVITLAHGSGGRKMHRLIGEMFLKHFGNPILRRLEDAAEFTIRHSPHARDLKRSACVRLALTTDSYVVQPLFFPGGDIGKLAICGTVNDLAVKGATPRYLATGFIISTGISYGQLARICRSMAATARRAGVQILTGDTKVIAGTGFGNQESNTQHPTPNTYHPELYINTSGIGVYDHDHHYGAEHIKPGDRILINGSIGDHEAAIVLARGEFDFHADLKSDCAPLNGLIAGLIRTGADIKMMRDPTRGGVATTLNEIAQAAGLGIIIKEENLVVRPAVHGVCELLGFEPLYLANEGKVLVVADRRDEGRLLSAMHRHPLARSGAVIAEVTDERSGVWLRTKLGSLRPMLMLEGQQLPRIC
jgi:hydrogenase expression/formation protein HypE